MPTVCQWSLGPAKWTSLILRLPRLSQPKADEEHVVAFAQQAFPVGLIQCDWYGGRRHVTRIYGG